MGSNNLPIYDIYTSAFLILHGILPRLQRSGTRVVFIFPLTPKVTALMDSFNENPKIPVLDFSQALRRLRAEMVAMRDGGVQR